MTGVEVVLASRNPHKLRELSILIAPHRLASLPRAVDLPPEEGKSFAANATSKARSGAKVTSMPTLGEDSGIEVAALGGEPGVRSARFAGEGAGDEENLMKLLRETEHAADRSAAYVCALAFADADDEELFEGRCEGRLARAPRGTGGFGYDPIFMPSDSPAPDLTMAELAPAQKNAISHRARAAEQLVQWLSSRK
jgi:XTP/dITP diphosphohydrolase